MKKALYISQILVYYDYPEIFISLDNVGTNYLCLLVDQENQNTLFIATAISPKRLSGFITGEIDIRDIFEFPESKEWYIFNNVTDTIEADIWSENALPEDYLPAPGFIYQKPLIGDELILNEVIEKKNAVVHLSISDAFENYSIEIDSLGNFLKLYQSTIENCFKKSLPHRINKEKRSFDVPQNYQFRAFASSYSSFNLHLYSTSQIDLFGNTLIEIGLEKFDEITREFSNEDEFISSLRTVKGHTISSLKKLVKQIIDSNIMIKHKWFAPNQEKVHFTIIDKPKAQKIFNILNLAEDLSEETKIFIGYFVQVDVEKATWRIFNTEDKKEYSGESLGQNLQGITVKTINYRLVCQEIIEELKVAEKEKIRYILQSIEQV